MIRGLGHRDRLLHDGQPGPVGQQIGQGDLVLVVLGEFRPPGAHRFFGIVALFLGDHEGRGFAVTPLVQENVGQAVSRVHGRPVRLSATPPHRSTTARPSTNTATAAPRSSPPAKPASKTAFTSANAGSACPAAALDIHRIRTRSSIGEVWIPATSRATVQRASWRNGDMCAQNRR